MTEYSEFLKRKVTRFDPVGFEPVLPLHPKLMPFQRDLTQWALKRGRAALWEDCGLGKTFQQIDQLSEAEILENLGNDRI